MSRALFAHAATVGPLVPALLAACQSVHVDVPVQLHYDGTNAPESPAARETFTLGLALVDRHQDDADPVDDALAWSLWFSKDLWDGVVRPAFEFGAGYSEHDVDGFRSAKLEVYRFCAGGKLTVEPEGLQLSLWGRTGWFYRFSLDPDFEHEPFDQDGGGYYLGCGFDLEVEQGLRIGPFFDYFKGTSQDELEERFYGLAVSLAF